MSDCHEDNRPREADYQYSYYYTEMKAIENREKKDLTYRRKEEKCR
jgi:hypothetical protein